MFLQKFDPASVDPLLLVNRKKDLDWLGDRLDAYLRSPPPHAGINFVVIGDKGCGKTILTRAAVRRAREKFSDRVAFVDVNCRDLRTAKAAFGHVARQVVDALFGFRALGFEVKNELIASAQILVAITRFDTGVELKVVHEHIEQFKEAVGLEGKRSFLKSIGASYSISIERSKRTVESMTGKITFDVPGLADAVAALFEDIRDQGFDVVVYLDNLDELRHEYRTLEEREGVRADVLGLLSMRKAPVVLLVNVRTYFSSILGREFPHRRALGRMSNDELLEAAYLRLGGEPPEVQAALADPGHRDAALKLAGISPAPLNFLTWFHRLADSDDLEVSRLKPGLEDFLITDYANVPASTLRAVAAAFPDPTTPISRELLVSACGSESVLGQLEQAQIVLPLDFWNPIAFTLDPYLAFLHPSKQASL
jgi:hypothetical protein